jgi:DNA-binding NarL/FixJ family response regulator
LKRRGDIFERGLATKRRWRREDCSGYAKADSEGVSKEIEAFAGCEPEALRGEAGMHTGARQARQALGANERGRANGERHGELEARGERTRVFVATENRLMHDALSRMLAKRSEIEVVGTASGEPLNEEMLLAAPADILLLSSRGNLVEDLALIRRVRVAAPGIRILLLGVTGGEAEFLQYVRAGIRGYLLREASAEDVLGAVRAVQTGHAVCPGPLCALLFRYFESEATTFPSATARQRLGLTRREQQLIPLVAQGMTNKEIANHFCLSEQTVKNHLYRMKQKVGAGDRLGIVQVCRSQGFLL